MVELGEVVSLLAWRAGAAPGRVAGAARGTGRAPFLEQAGTAPVDVFAGGPGAWLQLHHGRRGVVLSWGDGDQQLGRPFSRAGEQPVGCGPRHSALRGGAAGGLDDPLPDQGGGQSDATEETEEGGLTAVSWRSVDRSLQPGAWSRPGIHCYRPPGRPGHVFRRAAFAPRSAAEHPPLTVRCARPAG